MRKFIIFLLMLAFLAFGYGIYAKVVGGFCPDADTDGLDDCKEEQVYHTEKFNLDTDGDGYSDGDEVKQGYSPTFGNGLKFEDVDSDHDGLNDDEELKIKTDLTKQDTDADGVTDFDEVQNGSDPVDARNKTKKNFDFLRKLK